MPDPRAVAVAQAQLGNAGNQFMGMTFKAMAAALQAAAGPSFDSATFAARVGNVQLNRIGQTNDAGSQISDRLIIVDSGNFQDVSFKIAAPSDRFRVILGLKLTPYSKTDATAAIGDQNLPAGVMEQLIALGELRTNRARGRAITQRLWQYVTGGDNRRFVPSDDAAVAEPRTPSEVEILPWGLQVALANPLDCLNPKEEFNATIAGLAGVAAAAAYADDIGVAVDAICLDAIMSGQ